AAVTLLQPCRRAALSQVRCLLEDVRLSVRSQGSKGLLTLGVQAGARPRSGGREQRVADRQDDRGWGRVRYGAGEQAQERYGRAAGLPQCVRRPPRLGPRLPESRAR